MDSLYFSLEDDQELSTCDDNDEEFQNDLEALKQACLKTGTNPDDIQIDAAHCNPAPASASASAATASATALALDSESDNEDLELFRGIRSRLALSDDVCDPPLPPITSDDNDDDAGDDFETLRAIQRRFSAYTASESGISRGKSQNSTFPESAQLLINAIKSNRSCQKLLHSKLTQIEAKIEENKQLRERLKILKNLEISCKKRTTRALSMGKDPRIQFFSTRKSKASGKHCYGPSENSQAPDYRMALTKIPPSLDRKKWGKEERENLIKGIKQQFQAKVLQGSVDSWRDGGNLDNIIASIKDLEVTPEQIKEFVPQVNWEQLALMYTRGRSGAECEARWLNHEDPLINFSSWTAEEDKNLLFIIQEKGLANWHDIAVSLVTNRTPFQCLSRYQRSLNACILNREWTKEEDDKLCLAVEEFGERDWQSVASALTGRTGSQCSNRWKKSLHPSRKRVGRWSTDEDKRLKVAVMLFGPKNWKKIAEFVPGRTQVQCRERWVNTLDPSLSQGEWSEEEDLKLEAAIEEHGYCWSKIAACMTSRTDNQCWRRWKVLHPDKVPLFQEVRRIRKSACISNFVDRESERPAIGPNDFMTFPVMDSTSKPENTNVSNKHKRKRRKIVYCSCSKPVLDGCEDDDVTLACLRRKLKEK